MKFMPSITFQAIALVILSAVSVTHAPAQQVKAGDLVLDHAWARATPSAAKVGGGFLTIENKGAAPDKLMGASSPAAGKIEVHETAMNNGVATMRPVKGGLSIAPGQSVTLAPGGYLVLGKVETLYPEYRKTIKATYVAPEPCKTNCGAAPPR